MSFTISLNPDFIQIEPGATLPLQCKIENLSDQADHFEIFIEGIDPEWVAIPIPSFAVDGKRQSIEKILIKPARVSESLTGTYPFVIKLRSLQSGETRTAQGIIEIKPFRHLSIDISPKRGMVSPFHKEFNYQLTVMNLGNAEQTFQLFANDPEDHCAFEFESEKVILGPGQQKNINLSARSSKKSLLANSRLYGFSVIARSNEVASTMSTTQAQLEQKAIASPAAFFTAFLLFVIGLGWFATRPKPPVIERFASHKHEINLGETNEIFWKASQAKHVQIYSNNTLLYDNLDIEGSRAFQPATPGVYRLSIIAISGEKKSSPELLDLIVKEPIQIPPPKILGFKISPTTLHVGQTFAVQYKLAPSVVKATLSPPGIVLDPKIHEIELIASRSGEIEYHLIAENANGVTTERIIRVKVTEGSDAAIVMFKATPEIIDPHHHDVKVTWQLTNAVRAEIKDGDQVYEIDPSLGSKDLFLTKPVTLTLTAYDSHGHITEKQIKIKYKESEETSLSSPL